MIKTNTSRWYDVQCDAPDCQQLASAEYGQCIGWALPRQAVGAAVEAGWTALEEDGVEHMYCPWHTPRRKPSEEHVTYRAVCAMCGGIEYSKTTGTIDDAYADFIQRGWKVKCIKDKRIAHGVGVPLMICPDCAKKGQAK